MKKRWLPEILLAMVGTAVFIIGSAMSNNPAMSALLVLAGICVLSFSIMFYFFSPTRELKSEVYDAASISNALIVGNILTALKIQGNGVYVPASRVGRTMVFLPQSDEGFGQHLPPGIEKSRGLAFVQAPGARGVYMVPPGEGLMEYAKSIGATFYPEGLEKVMRDIMVNGTELASYASARREGDRVSVVLKNIAYQGMCRAIREDSPSVCQWTGCPVCSFAGCIVAECMDMNARVEGVDVDGNAIKLTYRLI